MGWGVQWPPLALRVVIAPGGRVAYPSGTARNLGRVAEWRPGERKWSEEQIAAVVRLQVDGGLTAKASASRCSSQTIDGLPPFQMPHTTASWYAARERRLRDGRGQLTKRRNLQGSQEALIFEAMDVVGHQLRGMYTARGRPRREFDARLFKEITRSLVHISQAIAATSAGNTQGPASQAGRGHSASRREADFFRKLNSHR